MNQQNKDSTEIVEFRSLFSRLKQFSDDDPDCLWKDAQHDVSVKELCIETLRAAWTIKRNEKRRRELFAAPVDPKFIELWRDYEDRFERVTSDVWASDVLPGLGPSDAPSKPKEELEWQSAATEAEEQSNGIDRVIQFAFDNISDEGRWGSFGMDFVEEVQSGIAAWDRLKEETGFNLEGIFRRRALVPFVLVPRKVAAVYGSREKLSLLKNLQQAHDAFVYGASYAALALMRSILEAALRDHYGALGDTLKQRIRHAGPRLPDGVNEPVLQHLRELANDILHLERRRPSKLLRMEEEHLEKEIVRLLVVLRALIEGAK